MESLIVFKSLSFIKLGFYIFIPVKFELKILDLRI